MVKKASKKSTRKVTKAPARKAVKVNVKSLKKKKVSTFWGLFSIFTVLVLVLVALTKTHMMVQDAETQSVLSATDSIGR